MKKRLKFSNDEERDVLDISIGRPVRAFSNEIDDDFFVRLDPRTNKIVGFSILNFKKRSRKRNGEIAVPITAQFTL